jgi:hypothetical protein
VTLRLAQSNVAAAGTQGPLGTADRTEPAALRAGLVLAQELALLSRCCFQGSLGHATRRRAGHFLHLGEIHVEPRPLFPEGVLDDDFSPLFSESGDRLQFFG